MALGLTLDLARSHLRVYTNQLVFGKRCQAKNYVTCKSVQSRSCKIRIVILDDLFSHVRGET